MNPDPASPISRAGILLDEAAAQPHSRERHILFNEAWRICEQQITALCRRFLGGIETDQDRDLLADAVTETARKLWRSVDTGYTPKHGYEATIAGTAQRGTANIIVRNKKHFDNPTSSLDHYPNLDDYRDNWLASTDDRLEAIEDDSEALQQHEQMRDRLDRASRRAHLLNRPHAGRILTHGLEDTNSETAQRVGITPRKLADELDWIRANQYALLQCSDQRFAEYLRDEMGGEQLDLMAVGA